MTRQELMNTYDSMTMPEERVAAVEAKLMKLFESSAAATQPETPSDPPKEYRFEKKKPSPMKIAAVSLSAAAAVALCIVGGKFLIDRLPVSPIDSNSETAETDNPAVTDEAVFETEEAIEQIRFESAEDIPPYERAGCFDGFEHYNFSETAGNYTPKADPKFTQQIRAESPVTVARLQIFSENSDDEAGYTEYRAVITDYLSGKTLTVPDETVTFRLKSTHSAQLKGEPSLAVDDEIIALVAEGEDELSLVLPEELLFECFSAKGQEFAAQRHFYWLDLADNATNLQHGDIRRVTTVTDNPAAYYGIYEVHDLAAALEAMVLSNEEALLLGTEPLPNLYSDFSLDFSLIDPFCYYWLNEGRELVCIDAREDIFGSVHGYEDESVPDMYCAGFFEDDLGWYMRGANRNGGDSLYYIPKARPERMYRYDFGSDAAPTRPDYSECFIRQDKGDWSFSDPNNDGSFYYSALIGTDRKPAENYVGQISWLGKEKLCQDHGENWAAEFNKWYNMGGTITFNGATYRREPLFAADDNAFYTHEEEDRFGAGRVWLIDHSDARIVAAFRFASEDWIAERMNLTTDTGCDLDRFYSQNGAAKYFILTAEYVGGEWQESWQERTNADAMIMEGVLSPRNYSAGYYCEKFAWGTESISTMMMAGSEMFYCNAEIDEYTLLNSYDYSRYLQVDQVLYVVGRESGGDGGLYLSDYGIRKGYRASKTPKLSGNRVEQIFLSPDQKYIMLVTFDDSTLTKYLYVFDKAITETVAFAANTQTETQFTLDDNGFTITKDGTQQRFDYDIAGLVGDNSEGEHYCKQSDGSFYMILNSPYIKRGEMETTNFYSTLYRYDAQSSYRMVLGESLSEIDPYFILEKMDAEFKRRELPSPDHEIELLGDYVVIRFYDEENTVWLFDKESGEMTPQKGYYDDVFEEADTNWPVGGPMTYEHMLDSVKISEEYYGGKAGLWLCETVRVLPEEEARSYYSDKDSGRTVYEIRLMENLITGEKSEETAILVMEWRSPQVQQANHPIYAPAELFTCAMVYSEKYNSMQAIYGYYYDVRTDGETLTAYSRANIFMDALNLAGSVTEKTTVITSTTGNPVVYTQKLPLSSVAQFVKKEWAERGIGQ